MLLGHRENMQTLTERSLVPQGGPRATKIPSDLRGVEIGSVRQAFGAGAAQPQHLLPEWTHVLPSFMCPGAAVNLPAVMSRLQRAAANYTADLQIGCSPITCCAHTWPTYVPVRPWAELFHLWWCWNISPEKRTFSASCSSATSERLLNDASVEENSWHVWLYIQIFTTCVDSWVCGEDYFLLWWPTEVGNNPEAESWPFSTFVNTSPPFGAVWIPAVWNSLDLPWFFFF